MKSLLLLLLLVGCGDVQGMPFGGELPGSGGAAGHASSGGAAGAVTLPAGSGGSPGTGGALGTGGSPAAPGGSPAVAMGGAAGTVPVASGGSAPAGTGGTTSIRGAIYVETLPACPDYVTQFGSPIATSRLCGISSDSHLLYGCVGVARQGYPLDTTPCQFTDPNNAYNDSHVFGCVDAQGC